MQSRASPSLSQGEEPGTALAIRILYKLLWSYRNCWAGPPPIEEATNAQPGYSEILIFIINSENAEQGLT